MDPRGPNEKTMNGDINDGKNNTINGAKQSLTSDQRGTSRETSDNGNITNNCSIKKMQKEAKRLFKEKKYDAALVQCTRLIEMCPNDALCYGSRAACYFKLENYVEALEDAKKSVELVPTFINGHCRVILSSMKLHELTAMNRSVNKLNQIDPKNRTLQYQARKISELSMHHVNEVHAKDYNEVLKNINKSLAICSHSLNHKFRKAECLANLGNFRAAEALAKEILERNPYSSESHHILGRCLFKNDIKKSVYHFEKAFSLDPDSDQSRELYEQAKEFLEKAAEAGNAYKAQNFAQAYDLYHRLSIEYQSNNAMSIPLYFYMAQSSFKLGNVSKCLMECEKIFSIQSNHLKGLLLRAMCHLHQEQYDKAVEDLEKASSIESAGELLPKVLVLLEKARNRLTASKSDLYAILQVEQGASTEVITEAYNRLKEFHELKCQEITRAYRLLTEQRPTTESPSNDSSGRDEAPEILIVANGSKLSSESSDNYNSQKCSSGNTSYSSSKSTSSSKSSSNPSRQHSSSGTSTSCSIESGILNNHCGVQKPPSGNSNSNERSSPLHGDDSEYIFLPSTRYCRHCDDILDDNRDSCNSCGAEYEDDC